MRTLPLPSRRLLPLLAAAAAAACSPARPPARTGPGAPPAARLELAGEATRCARGFAQSCVAAGRAHLLGDGTPADPRLGASLLTQACELGDPAGCADLGVLYALGRALPQSDERALALSRRACEQGSAVACSNHGALVLAGVGRGGARADPRGEAAAAVRAFRIACDAAVPEGCLNLATALEDGAAIPRDVAGAVRGFRRACDAGLALACQRLALVLAEAPALAPDLSPGALSARACAAAVEPACEAVNERPPPAGPRTPGVRLVADRRASALAIPGAGGFHPEELAPLAASRPRRTREEARQPTAAVAARVPAALHVRLGLDRPARADDGPDPAVEGLVALRRGQLGACQEAARATAGEVEVHALFLVDADGRTADVRTAASPPEPEVEACLHERLLEWEFPVAAGGYDGPYHLALRLEPAPAGPAPAVPGAGWARPALRTPGCVERALRLPAEYRRASGKITVRLAVDLAGAPARVHPLSPAPEPVVAAVATAVKACDWAPAVDARGRPAAAWTTLTVDLGGR